MAGNKSRFGPNVMTVQEATNSIAQKRIIRVTPTLDAGTAYATNDVLFNSTEIPNAVLRPGGTSTLVRAYLYNHKDSSIDFDLVFTQNQANLGTINDAVASGSLGTEALAKASKVIGYTHQDTGDQDIDLINGQLALITQDFAGLIGDMPMIWQASENSTSIYFAGIDRTGGVDFGADDLEFKFHVEY